MCWGYNDAGQLGNSTSGGYSSVPVAVEGVSGVTAIAAGGDHTCALPTTGTVMCWGYNDAGQLGNGTFTDSLVPVAVKGLSGVTAIAAGYEDTCALLTTGTVKCLGLNGYCQLGNGPSPGTSRVPVTVKGLSGATAITVGDGDTTCARLSTGTAKCWGYNANGLLGTGTFANSSVPLAIKGLSGATAIATGDDSTCARLSTGTVKCWGLNSQGQLGNGTTTDSHVPVAVTGL